eukprot:s1_g1504.t1
MTTFRVDDTAFLLVDHQVGTNKWAVTTPLETLERNAITLAKFAKGTGIPVVLTSSQETNEQGPIMPAFEEAIPEAYAARIKRDGIVNAWEEPAFVDATQATGRQNIVLAGVTTEVCAAPAAISAKEAGFNVKVVVDACGSPTQLAEEIAWRRLEEAHVGLTTTTAILSELARDWSKPSGTLARSLMSA